MHLLQLAESVKQGLPTAGLLGMRFKYASVLATVTRWGPTE
jgi:hypothetical protein